MLRRGAAEAAPHQVEQQIDLFEAYFWGAGLFVCLDLSVER
jgi:hypothetical protein